MAVAGWILDKSAAARASEDVVREQLMDLAGTLHICKVGLLEQLYSSRSAAHYDATAEMLHTTLLPAPPPPDLLDRALALQRDLARHHGMWHRISIPDLLVSETALHNQLGVVHIDSDYDRIGEVRPLATRRLTQTG